MHTCATDFSSNSCRQTCKQQGLWFATHSSTSRSPVLRGLAREPKAKELDQLVMVSQTKRVGLHLFYGVMRSPCKSPFRCISSSQVSFQISNTAIKHSLIIGWSSQILWQMVPRHALHSSISRRRCRPVWKRAIVRQVSGAMRTSVRQCIPCISTVSAALRSYTHSTNQLLQQMVHHRGRHMPWSARSSKVLAMALAPAATGTPKAIPVVGEMIVSSVINVSGSAGPEPSSLKHSTRPAKKFAHEIMHACLNISDVSCFTQHKARAVEKSFRSDP